MKICKVKDCERKHYGKGYCEVHHRRKLKGIPLTKHCKICKGKLDIGKYKYCSTKCLDKGTYNLFKKRCSKDKEFYQKYLERHRGKHVSIPTFGKVEGMATTIYTNGVTEQVKPLVKKIRDKVLEDCIRNPAKYLK